MLEIRMESAGVVVSDRSSFSLADQKRKLQSIVAAGDTVFGRCWFTIMPKGILVEPEDGISIRIKFRVRGGWMESLTRKTIFLFKDDASETFTLETLGSDAA